MTATAKKIDGRVIERVGHAVGHEVEPSAEERRRDARSDPEHHPDTDRFEGGEHGQRRPGHQPAQHVAAEVIRTEQVVPARPLEQRVGVERERALGGQRRPESSEDRYRRQDRQGDTRRAEPQHRPGPPRGYPAVCRRAHALVPSLVR